MTFRKIELSFPKAGEQSLSWQSIQYRPILNGSESITVAVIASNTEGDSWVRSTLESKQYSCLFAGFAKGVKNLADEIIEEAEEFSRHEPDFSGFQLNNAQFEISETNSISCSNIDDAWDLIIQRGSFLGIQNLDIYNSVKAKSNFPQTISDFRTNLRSKTLQLAPQLENRFSCKVAIANEQSGILVDFLGSNIAVNFGMLKQGSLARGRDQCRVRLWELLILRDFLKSMAPSELELMVVGLKETNSEKGQAFDDTLDELRYEAGKEDLKVTEIDSMDNTASRLVGKELAA